MKSENFAEKYISLFITLCVLFSILLGCSRISNGDKNNILKYIDLTVIEGHVVTEDCGLEEKFPEFDNDNLICIRQTDPLYDNFNAEAFIERGIYLPNEIGSSLEETGWLKTYYSDLREQEFNKTGRLPAKSDFIGFYEKEYQNQKCKVILRDIDLLFHTPILRLKISSPLKEVEAQLKDETYSFKIQKYNYYAYLLETEGVC